jgi:glycosyltransferase involved in cell wall biosynthesis
MKRRVCHILGTAALDGTGIVKIVSGLHQHIDHDKYELTACFMGEDGPLVDKLSRHGIDIKVIPWRHPSRDIRGAVQLLRYLRSQNFDIIHFHWAGPTVRTLIRWSTTSAIILHLHSEIEENASKRGPINTSACDLVIAVSRSVAKASQHMRTRVVYSGVDVPATTVRAPEKYVIGYAGRLVALKGLQYLLQAISLLRNAIPQLQLRIAGSGPELESLQFQAESLGLQNNVKFLGWLDDLTRERRLWTAMVQPSLEEGLPMSVLEAMAEAVPVVATRTGGLPELIDDELTGFLVPPADAHLLANTIQRVLTNHQLRSTISAAAATRIRQEFSIQRMTDSISAIYDELLLG